MINVLLNGNLYEMEMKDALLLVIEGWDKARGLAVGENSDASNPLFYETESHAVRVARSTALAYAKSERDSHNPNTRASFKALLAEAETCFDGRKRPDVFDDELLLYSAFAILHEIGHYVDNELMGDDEYERIGKQNRCELDKIPLSHPVLRAKKYRKLSLEASADRHAKEWLRELCSDG